MKTMLVSVLVLSLSLLACGKGGGEEPIACQISPEDMKGMENKIKADIEKHSKLREGSIYNKKVAEIEEIQKTNDFYEILLQVAVPFDFAKKINEEFTKTKTLNNIQGLHGMSTVLIDTFILKPWRKAIDDRNDFNTVLTVNNTILTTYGIFTLLDCHQKNLVQQVGKLDKNKYSKTLEMYAISTQSYELFKNPKGSLMSFSQTINQLDNDFNKMKALAELEWK